MILDTDETTITQEETATDLSHPWNVVVYDDPVNMMTYVTLVLQRVFGYSHEKAENLMLEVHNQGLSVVWSGEREKGELYVEQLHSFQLLAALKKS